MLCSRLQHPLSLLAACVALPLLVGKASPEPANAPTVSPTGAPQPSQLIFCNYEQVITIRPDGTERRVLANRKFVASPSLSFDGKRYAYEFYRTDLGLAETVIGRTDGKGPKAVVGKRTKDQIYMFPVLSPDGKSVLTQRRVLDDKGKITYSERLVLFEGNGKAHDLGPDTLFAYDYRFAPDGRSILFAKSQARGLFRISVRGGVQGAAQPIPIARDLWEFDLAPDGRHLVFTSPEKGDLEAPHSLKSLYVCTTEGTELRRLPLPLAKYRSPAWSPDGKHIAFTYDRGANPPGIRIVDSNGHNKRILTREPAMAGPVWR